MMEGGRTLVAGSPDELVRRVWPRPSVLIDARNRAALDGLALLAGVVAVTPSEGPVLVELDDLSRVPDLVAHLAAEGARVTRVTPHEPTLEELYFAVRSGELPDPVPVG
jgi:ABC-2 type transport system ATP-binding protein